MDKLTKTLYKLVHSDTETPAEPAETAKDAGAWDALRSVGTRLWLDSGDLEAVGAEWCPAFEAVTTNNTLLAKEVRKGMYDGFIADAAEELQAARPPLDEGEFMLAINLALGARHGLRFAKIFNAKVSVELHTNLANEPERSVEYARRLHALCPEHFIIKIPYTAAGLIAARKLGQESIPVNLTLGFSLRQNYLAALFANPCYVNVFLGRLNSFVEQAGLATNPLAGEKATLAAQRELRVLREAGQTQSHLIAASMRERSQVPVLAGVDVMTLPPSVAADYARMPAKHLEDEAAKDADFRISMLPGFTSADFNGASLWDLDAPVRAAVTALRAYDLDTLTPDALVGHFQDHGAAEFMRLWSLDEIDLILKDGKIPDYGIWGAALQNREMGLDALMSMAALGAFIADQAALDDHIRSIL